MVIGFFLDTRLKFPWNWSFWTMEIFLFLIKQCIRHKGWRKWRKNHGYGGITYVGIRGIYSLDGGGLTLLIDIYDGSEATNGISPWDKYASVESTAAKLNTLRQCLPPYTCRKCEAPGEANKKGRTSARCYTYQVRHGRLQASHSGNGGCQYCHWCIL